MPGKLVDMQIAYTKRSERLAHDIYNAFPKVLTERLHFYEGLLRNAQRDRSAYLAITREPPTAVSDRVDDIRRYLNEVHGFDYDDFCEVNEKIFMNTESKPKFQNVRGRDVFYIASFKDDKGDDNPDTGYMRLSLAMDALKRASARGRIAVAPYMPYQRQDRKDESRVPISFKAVADMLNATGMTRLLTLDMHSQAEQGFFDIPVDDLTPINLFLPILEEFSSSHGAVLVDPDSGSAKRNDYLMKVTGHKAVIVDKRRDDYDPVLRTAIGLDNLPGKVAVEVDDLISTGKTLARTASNISTYGPEKIIVIATHYDGNPFEAEEDGKKGVPNGLRRLQECESIDRIYVTDSNYSPSWDQFSKISVISIGEFLANTIFETQTDGSVSRLFPKIPEK
ncbi:MAG TPA: ribose-phosphate diphosphokinase [archaeon]|nr:ribose-phosphate diphosphokinase [archaeon]